MNIQIAARGFELTPAIRDSILQRFGDRLARGRPQIRSVRVHLSDVNGPRGGADKRVLATVELKDGREVIAQCTQPDLYEAVGKCSAIARRSVFRALNRADRLRRRGWHPRNLSSA